MTLEDLKLSKDDEEIVEEAKDKIPSIDDVLSEAIKRFPAEKLEREYIKNHFGECVVELEQIAHRVYLEYEEQGFYFMIDRWINKKKEEIENLKLRQLSPVDFAKEVCRLFYPIARTLEFRLGQMRKSRGGKTFELIVEFLLKRIGCKCEKPKKKELNRIDLVIPNENTALKRPDQAFFLACKRTLRERWKQTIPEAKIGWRVYLITIDEEFPEDKVRMIEDLGLIAYVRDDLKSEEHLKDKDWIRRLSDLPKDLGIV